MMQVRFHSGVESLAKMGELLLLKGEKVSPSGTPTRELRNVMINITNPADVLMTGINRKWNSNIAAAEALQLIGGFSDPTSMINISPTFKKFTNEMGEFDAAYGVRTGWQMQKILDRLVLDPETRQAVLQIWMPTEDLHSGSNDYPCTVYINFAIRRGGLHMTTHMRSNDIWWGWCYDLFQFTQLGWTVANYLGIQLISYIHIADSFHLYERDIPNLEALTLPREPRPLLKGIGRPGCPGEMSWGAFAQEPAHEFFYDEKCYALTTSEQWYIDRELSRFK